MAWRLLGRLVVAGSLGASCVSGCILPDYVGVGSGGAAGATGSGPGTAGTAVSGSGTSTSSSSSSSSGGGNCTPYVTQIGTGEGDSRVFVQRVVTFPSGKVAVAGLYAGAPLQIGAFALEAPPMNGRLFVAMLGADGAPEWATDLGASMTDSAWSLDALAPGHDGGVILAMGGQGEATAPGGRTYPSGTAVILALDAMGKVAWETSVIATGPQVVQGLHVATNGDILVTGSSEGDPSLRGEAAGMSAHASAFFARLTPAGARKSSNVWPSTSSSTGFGVLEDANGHVFVAGHFIGDFVDRSANELPGPSDTAYDGFLLELNPTDDVVRATQFGSDDRNDRVRHFALTDTEVVIAGSSGPLGSAPFHYAGGATQFTATDGRAGYYLLRAPKDGTDASTLQYVEPTEASGSVQITSILATNQKTVIGLSIAPGTVAKLLASPTEYVDPTVFVELTGAAVGSTLKISENATLSATAGGCGHVIHGGFSGAFDWYGTPLAPLGTSRVGMVASQPNVFLQP